jgi:predicted transposase/invertase (TIGR01784 family)
MEDYFPIISHTLFKEILVNERIRFNETDDLVDIRRDIVFKAVFTRNTPASRLALSKLVSALIGREVSIVTIIANEPPADNLRDRQIRFDINCIAGNGELVNVEMSLNPDPFEPVRLEFHAGKLFSGQDIRGSDKKYSDLKQAYQIAILAKERFFPDAVFYHSFEYHDPISQISLNGRSRIITLELSKLEKIVEKPTETMSLQEYWAIYFQYLTDKSKRRKINEIMEREEGIAMASEVLLGVSKDEIERARLRSEEKYELDMQSRMAHAIEKATEIGMEKGMETVARRAMAEGLSLDIIQKITSFDPETLRNLQTSQ